MTAVGVAVDAKGPRARRARKKANKQRYEAEMRSYLRYARYGDSRLVTLLKIALFFPIFLLIGKYTVDGTYDLILETHAPLLPTGIGLVAVGVTIPIVCAVLWHRGRRVSMGTALFGGLLLVILGGGLYYLKVRYPGLTDNTSAWHYFVSNPNVRHERYRDWPEGLTGGLFWGYWNWNGLKRRRRTHPLEHLFYFKTKKREWGWFANLINETKPELKEWMFWLLPVLVIAFGLPLAYGLWKFEGAVPSYLPAINIQGQSALSNFESTVVGDWPVWLTGILSAPFFGRLPAFGILDHAQEYNAQRCLIRAKGDVRRATKWYHMRGMQIRIAQEYLEGRTTPGGALRFVKQEVASRGPGVAFILRAIPWVVPLLFGIGVYVVVFGGRI